MSAAPGHHRLRPGFAAAAHRRSDKAAPQLPMLWQESEPGRSRPCAERVQSSPIRRQRLAAGWGQAVGARSRLQGHPCDVARDRGDAAGQRRAWEKAPSACRSARHSVGAHAAARSTAAYSTSPDSPSLPPRPGAPLFAGAQGQGGSTRRPPVKARQFSATHWQEWTGAQVRFRRRRQNPDRRGSSRPRVGQRPSAPHRDRTARRRDAGSSTR